MPTIVFRSIVEVSETLARRVLGEFPSSWSITNSDSKYVTVAGAATVNLDAYTTYIFAADSIAPIVVGWIYNANTVEVPLNGLTVVAPPVAPYLRNTASSSTNPIPVKVLAFT
jgi:hypothetical protein